MKKKVIALLLTAAITFLCAAPVYAGDDTQSTSYTRTMTLDGKKAVSQDAYLPLSTYSELGLNTPQDLYVQNGKLYIADTGNARIVCVDIKTEQVSVYGEGLLKEPKGVSCDAQGRIYVADSGNAKAYRFSANGELEFTFEKPTEPSYGKNAGYKPTKIAPGEEGGAYIVSEGTQAGIVQMSGYGDFLGYFASNEVSMSFFDKMVDIFLNEKQKSSFLKRTPPSFANIFKGEDRLVYTMNNGLGVKPKKHSISGLNMLSKSTVLPAVDNPTDMHITSEGRIFIVNTQGIITEITADGYFLCSFGGSSSVEDRVGLFEIPSGIGVDDDGVVYVLDREKGIISSFKPSPVQTNIHHAIDLYQDGMYDESQKILDNVLKFNDSSYFAHIYSAKNYMQKSQYQQAIEHYKIANNKEGYSEAFWEIRNIWLQNNLIYVIVAFLVLLVLYFALKLINQNTNLFEIFRKLKAKILNVRLTKDLTQLWFQIKHPIDNAYNIKILQTGNALSASVIIGMFIVLMILYQTVTGFIFAKSLSEYSVINAITAISFVLALFVIVHHLISSINDGRGTLRSIYCVTAYSLAPIIVFMPFIIIFANFATINEKFFMDFAFGILIIWSIANLILGLIEIHEYKFSEIVKNLLVTLFTMGVTILALSVGYLLIKQIFEFVYEIVTEVGMRV